MMSEEEYVALARSKYEEIKKLEGVISFYDYEKKFAEIWRELGSAVLTSTISQVGQDRRKKK